MRVVLNHICRWSSGLPPPRQRSQIFSSWWGHRGWALPTVNRHVFSLVSWLTEDPRWIQGRASPPAVALPIMLHYWSAHSDPSSHLAGRQKAPVTHTTHRHKPFLSEIISWYFSEDAQSEGVERSFVSVSSGQQFVFTSAAPCQLSKQQERFTRWWILFLHQLCFTQQVWYYIMLAGIMLLLAHIWFLSDKL